ncbi:MAG: ADP-ribosylglycohydrolase family protein [Prevotella sp.]|nr:ADP-ribosylglycohydrolase family protein [Prevotella sp.]
MLGAIIGDIVGSRFEFNPTNDYNFELFTDDCGFTDDTICTFAIADALLKGKDFGVSLHEWCRLYPHPKGSYGERFGQWVRSDCPQPYNSFGNGSAMRVSPVAWFCKSREQMLACAKMTAMCTHNHPEGVKGAQTTALAIFVALQHRKLKFEMDCGQSFIETCGEEAWRNNEGLLQVIDKINDLKILGSGLFSQWRYFNHWAWGHATEKDRDWFLTVLKRMQVLSYDV